MIDSVTRDLDYSRSVLQNTLDLIPAGAALIADNLQKLAKHAELPRLIQDENQKGYFSFPTAEELAEFKSRGLRVFTQEECTDEMQKRFLGSGQSPL